MFVNICQSCFERCDIKSEDASFDYAGTHCTNGIGGTHHCTEEVSDCCGEDVAEVDSDLVGWHGYLMILAKKKGIAWMVEPDPEAYAGSFNDGTTELETLGLTTDLWS